MKTPRGRLGCCRSTIQHWEIMSAPLTSVGPDPATPGVPPTGCPRRVGRPARRAASVTAGALIGAAILVPSARAADQFESRKDIAPPSVRVTTPARNTAPGLVFVAPKGGEEQRGPMIYDNAGNLVFFRPVPENATVLDFRAQTYQGKPVLTWWQGKAKRGYGFGKGVIYDQSYRQIARVRAGNGKRMDFHEFNLTPQGTALVLAYKIVPQDLRSVEGGKRKDLAMENVVQEIDVATGEVLLQVNLNELIAPRASYDVVPDRVTLPYDYIHANSVNLDDDGNLLVSARATHAVYKINRKSGRLMWTLGGKQSDFKLGKGARFRFQHDAQRQADGTITLFDNNADVPVPGLQSRGVQLRVNESKRRATLVRQFKNPKPQLAASQGNLQALPNDNVFIGWGGSQTNQTEFGRGGAIRFEARFTNKVVDTYRAYRFAWSGRPAEPPRAVARRSGAGTAVHASWNGATAVASFRVLGGASETGLQARATEARSGFETTLRYATQDAVLVVEALDAQGTVLGRSNPFVLG